MRQERRWLWALMCVWTLTTATHCAHAQKSDATFGADSGGELALTTERVVVFKDGYALFVKKARGKASADGRVYTDTVPEAAVLGSFWAHSASHTVRMQAGWMERHEVESAPAAAITMTDLLRANQGKQVQIAFHREGAEDITATLVELLERERPGKMFDPATMGPTNTPVRQEIWPEGGQLVVLQTPGGQTTIVPVSEIRTLSGDQLVTQVERKEEVFEKKKRLLFDLGKDAGGREVQFEIMYFAPGVRWIPTYQVEENDTAKAGLHLQAELLNEVEDIVDAKLSLVVGVPNFRFKNAVSPLALEGYLINALQQAAPGLSGVDNSNFSNAYYAQRSGEFRNDLGTPTAASGSGYADAMELVEGMSTTSQQDLFVYNAGRITLAKGARATLPLWSQTSPRRHLFTSEIQVARNAYAGGLSLSSGGYQASPLALSKNAVWHQLELENTSKVPWTTGAAIMMREGLPLGQELLTYSPPGAKVLLPVTVAVDVRADYEEEEIGRTPNAKRWDGNDYTEVRKKATITLRSFRKEKSLMRIDLSSGGRAENASSSGKITVNDFRYQDWSDGGQRFNNHSDIAWEVDLKAGDTQTLTVELVYYVR